MGKDAEGAYKKIENSVVGGFQKMSDKFVDTFLARDGETTEEAKERIANEQKNRDAKMKEKAEARKAAQEDMIKNSVAGHHVQNDYVKKSMEAANDVVKKSLEVSKNAGKR